MSTATSEREAHRLQSLAANAERFDRAVFGAYEAEPDWRSGLRAAAYAAARVLEAEPELTALALGVSRLPGRAARLRREEREQRLVDLIDAGRGELADPDSVPKAHAEVIFGGACQLIANAQLRGERRAPVSFVPELMYMAVRPYLGHEAAREELLLAPPQPLVAWS